ncbi:hypothetical protein IE53DRAFT_336026 [Violaceomyces palustris]|uniref:Uncharacterized protein n=1 Tax=Violaceomyces palustris TaxID=1673888 RepID=A0ACD0NMN6_9BASI|nr:hypothetical protein IE53DRAFT_336026 [Violaceomyces palustris]
MDIEMRDGSRRNAPRRGASGNQQRTASGSYRSDPYARDARQRPNASRMRSDDIWKKEEKYPTAATTAASAYPPPELSIKGASGPTWVLVSNLVKGTSVDDIKLTFETFGSLADVKERPPPLNNFTSVSFEVGFDRKEDAEMACSKFDGALADGRVLQVRVMKPEAARDPYSQFSRAAAAAASQRPRDRRGDLIPVPSLQQQAPPSQPAAMALRSQYRAQDLLDPRARNAAKGSGGTNGAAIAAKQPPTGPKAANKPLASRLLTPAQAQKLRAAEARMKAQAQIAKKLPVIAGKGAKAPPTGPSLKSRIGSLPLAQRLAEQAGIPKSDVAAIEAAKKKKAARKPKKKAGSTSTGGSNGGAASMEMD